MADHRQSAPLDLASPRRLAWRQRLLALTFVIFPLFAVVGPVQPAAPALAIAQAPAVASDRAAGVPAQLLPYVVHLDKSSTLVVVDASVSVLKERARSGRHDLVAQALAKLASEHLAGPATYDSVTEEFRVNLSDAGRQRLGSNRLVASIDPAPASVLSAIPPTTAPPNKPNQGQTIAASIDYIQVYTPFMWGHANFGGEQVTLELLDSTGATTIGVPIQTYFSAPDNLVKIDRYQLYYETVFVDPNNVSHPSVMILPGDQVHVVTTGVDNQNVPFVDDKKIVVDNITAWTSFANASVSGVTTPNSTVHVTVTTGGLDLSHYVTPGNYVSYDDLVSKPDGTFTVSTFHQSPSAPLAPVTMNEGSTGFVRVQHASGDETFTYHGQNVKVLENYSTVLGWFYGTPRAPNGLVSGIGITRPDTLVGMTLKDSQGQLKSTLSPIGVYFAPTWFTLGAPVAGGDTLTITVNGVITTTVPISPLTAVADVPGNQVTGTGPAGTSMAVNVGQIDGYLTMNSTYSYIRTHTTTNGAGAFSTGGIACGSNGNLAIKPGSFGYAGFEDSHGNFIYTNFAAPRNDVMVGLPFVEGYVANSLVHPTVAVTDLLGGTTQSTPAPQILFLDGENVFFNIYYNLVTATFLDPGVTVSVSSGGIFSSIVVDQLAANPVVDGNTVVGRAPLGSTVTVIPAWDRAAKRQLAVDGSGNFVAANPFTFTDARNCSSGPATENMAPGSNGRVYLTHPDGNKVFAPFGRSIHVNENDNLVDSYLYPTGSLDWYSLPQNFSTTISLTRLAGSPAQITCTASTQSPDCGFGGAGGDQKWYFFDQNTHAVLPIRAGDSVSVSFSEGINLVQRPASLSFNSIPRVFLGPDLSTGTVGGIGPASWEANAYLPSPPAPSSNTVTLLPRPTNGIPPFSFTDGSNHTVPVVQGYTGTISFSDTLGHRVWTAWAATAYLIKIDLTLRPGASLVCGVATPNNSVTIYDVSVDPILTQIGAAPTDGAGRFCVTVSPPLYDKEVIVAEDNFGTFSEATVVSKMTSVFLPVVYRN